MANLRTNNLSGEQGQNAYRGSVNFVSKTEADYLQVSANSDLSLTGDFTIEYWTWISDSETHTRQISSGNYYTAGKNGNWYFGLSPTSGNVVFYTYDGQSNSQFVNISQTISLNSWHHAAAVRSGDTVTLYLNGISIGSGNVDKDLVDGADGGLQIGRLTVYGSHMGYISNLRILKGQALYTSNFTPPFTELKAIPNTVLLCCQNSDDVTQEETGKTITGNGNLANADFNKSQPKVIPPYGVDAGNTFGGPIQQSSQGYMYFPTGRTEERGRGRGLFGGGVTPSGTSRISFVNIQSQGNSIKFGSLTRGSTLLASCSSQTRGLWGGNYPSATNVIDFVTIATTGDAQDFGDLTVARWNFAALSNETRGVFCGGHSPTQHNTMDFVTMATLGDATDFGDLLSKFSGVSSCASPTRGLIFGGTDPSGSPISGKTNIIEFITIASTGNAQDFGDLTEVKHNSSGLSSQTRGINAGGNPGGMSDVIAFVTIATTGDATDFGNLITGRQGPATASNSIRGLFASGVTPSNTNLIDFITIATTGDASDFGDIDSVQTHFPEGCSDSHGGLS
jgi:hypothetical protein